MEISSSFRFISTPRMPNLRWCTKFSQVKQLSAGSSHMTTDKSHQSCYSKQKFAFLKSSYHQNYTGKYRLYCTDNGTDQQKTTKAPTDKVPIEALTLGVAGLIPFVLGAVGVLALPIAWGGYVAFLQMTYSASILSFLGAVHWGFAATNYTANQSVIRTSKHNWLQYGFGITPSLISWISLTQSPLEGMALLLIGHTTVLLGDLYATKQGLTPAWYPRLRFPLYLGVMVSLGTTFLKVL